MSTAHDPTILPAGIPVPQDDGAARHLTDLKLPSVPLAATNGSRERTVSTIASSRLRMR